MATSSTVTPSGEKPRTIAAILEPYRVPLEVLDDRYHPILMLVKSLLGIAPNAASYFEIVPNVFKAYNLLVPNFINVPFVLWGLSAPPPLIGLAMYFAARSARCSYCTVHTCVFALRRGTNEHLITAERPFNRRESAVVDVALNMSSFPSRLTSGDRRRLYACMSDSNVEWVVLSISMMGYLTTFMNALGLDLEQTIVEAAEPLLETTGWTTGKHGVSEAVNYLQQGEDAGAKDSLWSNLSMLKFIPSALKYDMDASKGVPKSWPDVGEYLSRTVGYSFPILSKIKHSRVIGALAAIICLNLDGISCSVEPDLKYLVGMQYAAVHSNRLLLYEFRKLAFNMCPEMKPETIDAVCRYAREETDFDTEMCFDNTALQEAALSDSQKAFLYVSKGASYVPSRVTESIVDAAAALPPKHIMELLSWVGICALLQRLYLFYYPDCSEKSALVDARYR